MIRIGEEIRQADIELGARLERERIIKLLKDSNSVMGDWAIALIKGEQK
jgi:hypothetical protein